MSAPNRRVRRFLIIAAVLVLVSAGGGYFWFMHRYVTEPVGSQPRAISPECLAPDEEVLRELRTTSESTADTRKHDLGDTVHTFLTCSFEPALGSDGSDRRLLRVTYDAIDDFDQRLEKDIEHFNDHVDFGTSYHGQHPVDLAGPWDQAYRYEWHTSDSNEDAERTVRVVFRKGLRVVQIEYSGTDKTYRFWRPEVPMSQEEAETGAELVARDLAGKI